MTHEEAVSSLAAERYLLNEMTERDRQTFEEHFFDCEVCADEMRSAAAMLQGAKAGFAGTGTKAAGATTATPETPRAKAPGRVVPMVPKMPSSSPVWYRAATVPWAIAATLAVVTAYQSFMVMPSLRRDSAPTALTPVTVRPASRGADAIVPLGTGPTWRQAASRRRPPARLSSSLCRPRHWSARCTTFSPFTTPDRRIAPLVNIDSRCRKRSKAPPDRMKPWKYDAVSFSEETPLPLAAASSGPLI
jgi:hypothetical protein